MIDPAAGKSFARVCSDAARASAEYSMLEPGDRVLAALSGGVDSFVMLEVLLHLRKRVPFEIDVQAITFDPQFPELDVQLIRDFCVQRGVRHHLVSVNIPELLTQEANERLRRPCVRCSRLRRGKLYGAARELGFGKLALGHHADDLLESFVISLVRGQGLTTMGLNVECDQAHNSLGELRLIRPLGLTAESTVKAAAGCFEFPECGDCPFQAQLAAEGDRAWAKEQIALWSRRIPDLRQLMIKSLSRAELPYLLDKRYLNNK